MAETKETQAELLQRLQGMSAAEAAQVFLELHAKGDLVADFNQDGRVTPADWSAMLGLVTKEAGWLHADEQGKRKFLITGIHSDRGSPDADITRCFDFEEAYQRNQAAGHYGAVFAFEKGAIHTLPRQIKPTYGGMVLRPYDITEPALVRTLDSEHGINCIAGSTYDTSIALMHLKPMNDTLDGAGIRVIGDWAKVAIVGCSALGFDTPILVQGDASGVIGRVIIHRNVTEVGTRRSHAQNIYVARAGGLQLTDNFLLNPLQRGQDRQDGTIFGHGGYIQANVGAVTAIGNLVESAQSHGLQIRPGGRIEHNLFLNCPIGLLVGNHHDNQQAVESELYRNFALYCGDIRDESRDPEGKFKRGTGFYFEGVKATARQCAAISPRTRRDIARAFELTEGRGADVTLQECGGYGYGHLVRSEGSADHVCTVEGYPNWSTREVMAKDGTIRVYDNQADPSAVAFAATPEELLGHDWLHRIRNAHYGAWPVDLSAHQIINDKIIPAFYRTA